MGERCHNHASSSVGAEVGVESTILEAREVVEG